MNAQTQPAAAAPKAAAAAPKAPAARQRPRMRAKTIAEIEGTLILPTRCLVLIKRDMTEEIPKLVYEHEVDILLEVHGGNVKRIDDPLEFNILIADLDTLEQARRETRRLARAGQRVSTLFTHTENPMRFVLNDPDNRDAGGKWVFDPVFLGDEMNRLRQVYGMHHERKEPYADHIYPHPSTLLEAAGGPYVADEGEQSADAA